MQVRVLGEGFTPEDEEDSASAEVSRVWAYQARYRVPLGKAVAGLPSINNPCSSPPPRPPLAFRNRACLANHSFICSLPMLCTNSPDFSYALLPAVGWLCVASVRACLTVAFQNGLLPLS